MGQGTSMSSIDMNTQPQAAIVMNTLNKHMLLIRKKTKMRVRL